MDKRYIGYMLFVLAGLFLENGSVKELWWSHVVGIIFILIAIYIMEKTK